MKSNDAVVRLPALLAALSRHGKTLAVAESLTGGRLASAIVSVPGASASFRGGVVAYACEAKNIVLRVSAQRLGDTGPVDGVVAEEMATGVARLFHADYGISTTGVAGPGSANGHEAGTVWIGLHTPQSTSAKLFHFSGNREEVRNACVRAALTLIEDECEEILGNSDEPFRELTDSHGNIFSKGEVS
ncbi:CinA family protein [Trueperella pyogenes]|uniref:CinA family protein n=1 Tax=Trueperella pyogenes TaxID=1661 RepID=UPI00324DF326